MIRRYAVLALATAMVCGLASMGCGPEVTRGADKAADPAPDPADPTADDPLADPVDEPDPIDPFADNWVHAPAGWCDDPDNLFTVWNVIDGDTIEISGGDKVRYIGVDAPETNKNECWSAEAEDALQALTPSKAVVCLLPDEGSSPVDPYDRLLRYVFMEEDGAWVMQNARLVRQGSARAYHQFLSGKDYAYEIKQAESDAKVDKVGLWFACN